MKYLILLSMTFFYLACSGQTEGSANIYAYKQDVLPGANRGIIEEGGTEVKPQGDAGKNYYIYLAASSRIYPAEIWINGIPYSARMEIINTTPVTMEIQGTDEKKILVPETDKKVFRLSTAPYIETKNFDGISRMASENELVVVYKQNGKFYYNKVERMTILSAAAMQ